MPVEEIMVNLFTKGLHFTQNKSRTVVNYDELLSAAGNSPALRKTCMVCFIGGNYLPVPCGLLRLKTLVNS